MRRATAVPVVIFALALIAALVLGTSFVTRRLAANARLAERSAVIGPLAEQQLIEAVVRWDTSATAAQPLGATAQVSQAAVDGIATAVSATRLSSSLYWVVVASTSGTVPRLSRRVGALVSTKNGAAALVPGRAWGELP